MEVQLNWREFKSWWQLNVVGKNHIHAICAAKDTIKCEICEKLKVKKYPCTIFYSIVFFCSILPNKFYQQGELELKHETEPIAVWLAKENI